VLTIAGVFTALSVGLLAVTFCTHASRERASAILRGLDVYASKHVYTHLEFVQFRKTELGGSCTLLALGAIAAISANIIAQHFTDNAITQVRVVRAHVKSISMRSSTLHRIHRAQSALLPLGPETIPGALALPYAIAPSTRVGWPPLAGLQLVIAAQGQSPGDCAINGSAPGVVGLEYGSSKLTVLSSGTTAVNLITCADCIFGPASSFSAYFPYTCQSFLIGVVTTDAIGIASLQSVAVPPTQGLLLSTVSWGATPLLQVCICHLAITYDNAGVAPLCFDAR